MIKILKKNELQQLVGGVDNENDNSDLTSINFCKRNTNNEEGCQCKYTNVSKVINTNNEYACQCVCTNS